MGNYNLFDSIKELDKAILKKLSICDKFIPTQMKIVKYILNSKKEVSQKDIEKALNLSKATVSDVINRMEKKNLIIRKENNKDFRSKYITLSSEALDLFNEHKKKLEDLEKILEKNISKSEIDTFYNIVSKMIKNVSE